MFAYMAETRKELTKYLREFFAGLGPDYDGVNSWGRDTLARLLDYACGGKMLRGALACFTHDMYSGGCHEAAVAAGAAMEIFQSAFLVHDDIMDRDQIRRGKPAMHAQYTSLASTEGLPDPVHLGEALGICAGDLALFIAFDILSRAPARPDAKVRLFSCFCRELEYVGLAQMADVWQGAGNEGAAIEDILALYRCKTGRYTFSLPFAAGLILAGQDEQCVNRFVLLGEKMGILFQIKDDELGLWADEKELGKPVGSDIAENKKTLHREILFARADKKTREKLAAIFGNAGLTREDVDFVRSRMDDLGVRAEAAHTAQRLYREASALMDGLPPRGPWTDKLRQLLVYNMSRNR
jgi:geranylgeranyl diphosphate synthase type I